MDGNDVTWGWEGTVRGGSRRAGPRTSRKNQLRSERLFLIHKPTGIRIEGTIPEGHYTKTETKTAKERLWATLWAELNQKVAEKMRIPGR
jgi:hypothetical protein